ncbi:MAG: hypothetical protein IJX96_02910 [Clostridia bacterium]|nr:hypothetical protein [Clostridia bacterium]
MDLYATDLRFMGDNEEDKTYDFCIHGKVVLKIDGVVLSDGNTEWCVSASAYHFLRTLFQDRLIDAENQIIPCCGEFLIPSEDQTTVTIIGCPNGIDFSVSREKENIIIRMRDNKTFTVRFDEYASAVIAYAKQIEDFYRQNPPRRFQDKFDKNGFSAFCNEWYTLMNKARAFSSDIANVEKIVFDEKIYPKNIKITKESKKPIWKDTLLNVLKELGAGLVVASVAVVLFLLGIAIFYTDDLPMEFFVFLGFFVVLAILCIIAAIVYIIQKIKAKHTKKKNSDDKE